MPLPVIYWQRLAWAALALAGLGVASLPAPPIATTGVVAGVALAVTARVGVSWSTPTAHRVPTRSLRLLHAVLAATTVAAALVSVVISGLYAP